MRLRPHRPCPVHRAGPHRPPGPARPARGGDGPARRDPARRPLHLRRLRVRLGRASTTAGCVDAGLLHFTDGLRTAEDRPWIWRLHREAESFAVVGLLGVFYRRGVASSLTQIGDVRQLDFIRAFDQVVEETAQDPRRGSPAAEGGAHLLRDHFPPSRIHRKVRTAGGPETAVDERRGPEAHAAGRTRRTPWTRWTSQRASRLRRLRRRPVAGGGRRLMSPDHDPDLLRLHAVRRRDARRRARRRLLRAGRPPLLLVSNNAATPETTPAARRDARLRAAARAASTRCCRGTRPSRPFHPGGWAPARGRRPAVGAASAAAVGPRRRPRRAGRGVHPGQPGARASPSSSPARPIDVYADGLMSYGPTRNKLDPLVGTRIGRLLHLDLVPGLTPLLLTEFGVRAADRADRTPSSRCSPNSADDAATALPAARTRPAAAARPVPLRARHPHARGGGGPPCADAARRRRARPPRDRLQAAPDRAGPLVAAAGEGGREAGRRADRAGHARSSPRSSTSGCGPRWSSAASPPRCSRRPRSTACRSPGSAPSCCWSGSTPYQNSNRVPVTIVDALLPDLARPQAVRAGTPPAHGRASDLTGLVTPSATRCSRRSTRTCGRPPSAISRRI